MITDAGAAILADIKAKPDDLGLRLIYADWLEDHGGDQQQMHAALIRYQIQASRLLAEGDQAGCRELMGRLRMGDLVVGAGLCEYLIDGSHLSEGTLIAGDRFAVRVGGQRLFVANGFVEECHVHLPFWRKAGPQLCRDNPVRKVNPTCRRPIVVTRPAPQAFWTPDITRRLAEDWSPTHTEEYRWRLPTELYDAVESVGGGVTGNHHTHDSVTYATEIEAMDALGRGMILWAERQGSSV